MSTISRLRPCRSLPLFCKRYHLTAMLIGVVRQAVNISAGRSGFMGRISLAPHAPSWMHWRKDGGGGLLPPLVPLCWRNYFGYSPKIITIMYRYHFIWQQRYFLAIHKQLCNTNQNYIDLFIYPVRVFYSYHAENISIWNYPNSRYISPINSYDKKSS